MNQIKTWQQRQAETGIGSIQAKEDEIDDLRAALQEREARMHEIATDWQVSQVKLKERDAEIRLLKASDAAWKKGWDQAETKLAAQRRVLEQALEALNVMQEDVVSTPNAYEAQRQAVRAILEVLHE
jgi:septal ring factor EnvC (AmiA/AmiB activator)